MRSGLVILVTGSSRGIGATLVEGFLRVGHRLILNYAHADAEAGALYDRLAGQVSPDRLLKIKASVARRADVQRMFAQAIDRFGRVDALVNNAGLNFGRALPHHDGRAVGAGSGH